MVRIHEKFSAVPVYRISTSDAVVASSLTVNTRRSPI
jgi:hypothetical protein